ncbi:Zn-dependent exopeptidase [Amylostereum chailletii]|nr:Zn-dependent exopeptidase [Amylostereum chailletii]
MSEAFGLKHKEPLRGRAAEDLFLTIPNSARAIQASRLYATEPHLAGSDGDLRTAEYFLSLLQEELTIPKPSKLPIFPAGSPASRNATLSITNLTEPTAWIDVYYPVLNTPVNKSLQILEEDGTIAWNAELEEVSDGTDEEATKYSEAVPTWHGLSCDGEVEGRLINADYGRKGDYDALVARGVNLTGAIILTRYGANFRGLKIKAAQEYGAAGVLIYSDPRDDGYVTEANGYAPYPHGPARNPTSVQRGSVQFLSLYPGDPTTPGFPSYENATRTEGLNIPSIPSLPISWENAQVLLKEIEGKNRTIKLVNHVDTKVTPIWNPMGVIPGHIKDEVIVVGNHRDAWVMGATDPSSGTVSVHEVVRGLGTLLKAGWKPLRTIVIASWDAEEYGLIGSTEWGEDFAEWIQKHVVAYFNLDSSVSGSHFSAAGSPSFAHFIRQTALELPHPTDPSRTLWDARDDKGPLFGKHIDDELLAMEIETKAASDSVGVRPLGSGSDYTVFLQRLGVASLDSGFGGSYSDPVYHYHSIFDSERWQEVYSDPGFVKHVAVAKHLGLQVVRMADSIVIPINTTHYSFELERYLDTVEELAAATSMATNLAPLRAAIKSLQFASIKLDHEKSHLEHILKRVLRHPFPSHGHHHQGKLDRIVKKCRAILGFKNKHDHMHEEQGRGSHMRLGIGQASAVIEEPDSTLSPEGKPAHPHWPPHFPHPHLPKKLPGRVVRLIKAIQKINHKLAAFEAGFVHEDGIKEREWYRHLGVAPGKWLGYGATTLPALTEAITIEKNATLAEYEAKRLQGAIEKLTDALRA